MLSPYLFLSL